MNSQLFLIIIIILVLLMIHRSSNNIPRLQEPFTDIGLYPFTSHTFTNAGAVGSHGPTLAQIRTAYSAMPWTERFINMTIRGIQLWTVPKTGEYVIQAFGASARGFGIVIRTTTTFNKGDIIRILVGQMGTDFGGGGGTFIVTNSNIPILIAGGGGGATNRHVTTLNLTSATININGNRGGASGGNGGTNGNGGIGHEFSSGGGGLFGNGGDFSRGRGGTSFMNGGLGGLTGVVSSGGFGGGGSGGCNNNGTCFGGGGGGYSGGGGGGTTLTTRQASPTGGGGGSFSNTNIMDVAEHMGHGLVIITLIEE
jgi:hypothetical protein